MLIIGSIHKTSTQGNLEPLMNKIILSSLIDKF